VKEFWGFHSEEIIGISASPGLPMVQQALVVVTSGLQSVTLVGD
jgi:hypothetical protein